MVLPGGVLWKSGNLATLVGAVKLAGGAICAHHHVLALDSREEMVSGQTLNRCYC